MNLDISERAFEEAIECGLLLSGPDACARSLHIITTTGESPTARLDGGENPADVPTLRDPGGKPRS